MTTQRRVRRLGSAVGRAMPRLIISALGLGLGVLLLRSGNDWLVGASGPLLFLVVAQNWDRWARYVATGTRPQPTIAAELTEPGSFGVELQASGPDARSLHVLAALRRSTGMSLDEARTLMRSAPASVVDQVSEESARKVRDLLERAGASASVVAGGAA